jgi:hypothetical protein
VRVEFRYLDHLRVSGEVNMFGAGPYLQAEFGLDRHEARKVLLEWMQQFKKETRQ